MARQDPDPTDLPDNAGDLAGQAETVLRRIEHAGLSIATAESCTGGLLASLFTDIEGLSSNFERGFVTYSVAAKCELLGIEPAFIERHGVVSGEVARAMAEGALAHSKAGIAVGVTGFAGRAGPNDEAGLVYLGVIREGHPPIVRECHFGDVGRDRVRLFTARAALDMLEQALDGR